MLENIRWLGHASIQITGSKVIYIDPWKLDKGLVPADIIFITHSHYDHCDPRDVAKVAKRTTVIVAPKDAAGKFPNLDVRVVKPGDTLTIEGVVVKVIPAYNVGKQFHPKTNSWVGYLITIDGKTVYHPGDTDVIPEMEELKPDIALLPIGGTYTMDVSQAAALANKMQPGIAVPIHYGDIVGSWKDAEKFKELCLCKVEILEVK